MRASLDHRHVLLAAEQANTSRKRIRGCGTDPLAAHVDAVFEMQLGMHARGSVVSRDPAWISAIRPLSDRSATVRADGSRAAQV